jgi:formate dehydrogenase subunit gamma
MSHPATPVLHAALARHQDRPGALLPILHDLQDALGHVPEALLPEIARALNLSRAEVQGVLSYYPHFLGQPAGRRLQVCRAEACRTMGGEELLRHAREHHAGAGWAVEPVYCLGLCASSPAALVDDQPHARLTPASLDALLAAAAAP